jgi:hypothetical protein
MSADRLAGHRFREVPLRERLLTRAAARHAWVKANGKGEDAIIELKADPRIVDLDPALIALLVQIALALFAYWFSMGIDEPSIVPQSEEPISWEERNDAD